MSGRALVICCRWTSSVSLGSPGLGTASPATVTAPPGEAQPGGLRVRHSIIDDHTRLAYTELHPDEQAPTVTAFLERALEFYAGHGITPKRLQTDNALSYIHNRSLRELLARHGIHHRRIPPRTPKRNGKVERYQQTLAREWAYGQRYRSSNARAKALPIWLNHYNTNRNHSELGNRPPISRVRNQPRQNTRARSGVQEAHRRDSLDRVAMVSLQAPASASSVCGCGGSAVPMNRCASAAVGAPMFVATSPRHPARTSRTETGARFP